MISISSVIMTKPFQHPAKPSHAMLAQLALIYSTHGTREIIEHENGGYSATSVQSEHRCVDLIDYYGLFIDYYSLYIDNI